MNVIVEVGRLVGNMSGSFVTAKLISSLTPDNLKTIGKIAWVIGGTTISSVVGSKAGDYMADSIETVVEFVQTMKGTKVEEN